MNTDNSHVPATPGRRQFPGAALLTAGLLPLAACTSRPSRSPASPSASASASAYAAAIRAAEAKRPHSGATRSYTLSARQGTVDLGGRTARTWLYDEAIPGKTLRAKVGDELAITLNNQLAVNTSIHWHGIAIRNDMDGVVPTAPDVAQGSSRTYRLTAANPGTYWYHPHVGVQADYGLYGPLIIDDPAEPGAYDYEWIIVLDDWTDGVGDSPDQILARLRGRGSGTPSMSGMAGMSGTPSMSGMAGMSRMPSMSGMAGMGSAPGSMPSSMPGMAMGVGSSPLLGGDAGDIAYPLYLVNGRTASAPEVFTARVGQRVRLRIINAAADTAFRVALAGHQFTVTHTDGYPVQPRRTDALLLGMGERYDAMVTLGDGVFPLVALAEGKNEFARALVRTASGRVPDAGLRPAELDRQVGVIDTFTSTPQARLAARKPDTTLTAALGGDMNTYVWTINGRTYDESEPFQVAQGQRVRLVMRNDSMMWHPMHLHGHTFQIVRPGGAGARKDTAIVRLAQTVAVDWDADNPGAWMFHCHNEYHLDAGMMTRVDYQL